MTGKRYYLTTLGDWQRHAADFSNSHYVALAAPAAAAPSSPASPDTSVPLVGARHAVPGADSWHAPATDPAPGGVPILALIEADEGVHLALEDDAAFEPLPHPLANQPLSDAAQAALSAHGVPPGSTTFDAAEILARVHPLLRHRIF